MRYLTLALGQALPWVLGWSLLAAADWPRGNGPGGPRNHMSDGRAALRLGFSYLIGIFLLTLWMRLLSLVGVQFGWLSISLPLVLAAIALFAFAARKQRFALHDAAATSRALFQPTLTDWRRVLWLALVAWLLLRFALLAAGVAWQPLYPWDAWAQWATKARVWYELGRIAPFVPADAWLGGASTGGAYFDAAPNYPATMPLLQVWGCIALGQWDDAAMNWPWLLLLLSLVLGVYGALRGEGIAPLLALCGAYAIASLPLLDTHVALAGYADLPMATTFTLAALAVYRWAMRRDPVDAALAIALAICCPLIKTPGYVWALLLLPSVIVALMPQRGLKLVCVIFALALFALLALARSDVTLLGYHLQLDFNPQWQALGSAYFLSSSWNLLWYGAVAAAVFGAHRLRTPRVAPLAVIVAAGLGFLLFVSWFTNASAWLAEQTTLNRASLHLAPLVVVLAIIVWREVMLAPSSAVPSSAAALPNETASPVAAQAG